MRFILFFSLIYLVSDARSDMRASIANSAEKNPKVFNIGGVLSNDDSINHFKETIEVINNKKKNICNSVVILLFSLAREFRSAVRS